MGIFERRRPFPPGPAVVDPDPAFGDPDRAEIAAAVARRDWAAVTAILDKAADFNDLSALVDAAARVVGSETWLADLLTEEPNDARALLLRGARSVAWAWEARTRKRAHQVSQEQFALFFERLRIAEDCLQAVVRREAGNATAWHQMIITARGLQMSLADARSRFDQAVAHQPEHLRAHLQLLQNLCPKWYGSVDEVREFVRKAVDGASPGSPLAVLVPISHLELSFEVARSPQRYLRSRAVRRSIQDAADRSINHPAYVRGREWALVHNTFAMLFALSENWKPAAQQFQIVGTTMTETPWNLFFNDPGRGFVAMRDRAYRFA